MFDFHQSDKTARLVTGLVVTEEVRVLVKHTSSVHVIVRSVDVGRVCVCTFCTYVSEATETSHRLESLQPTRATRLRIVDYFFWAPLGQRETRYHR